MISIRSFIALETSLADRLLSNFKDASRVWAKEVEKAIAKKDFDEAVRLVNALTLRPMAEESRGYIAWMTNLMMLFGASRVTARPGTSVVGLGREKEAIHLATETFIQSLIDDGEATLREQGLQLIALHRNPEPAQKAEAVQKAYATAFPEQIDPQKLDSYDPNQRVLQPFSSFVDSAGDSFFNIVSSLHTSRVAAYGFTAEADALGLTEYQITEQLDNRTCPVCEVMHGQIFPVEDARNLLGVALRVSSPSDLKYVQPWPSQSKAAVKELSEMDTQELIDAGWNVPPFHPRCRGLLSRVGRVPTLDQINTDTVPEEGTYTATQDDFEALGYFLTQDELDTWNQTIGVAPSEVAAAITGQSLDGYLDNLMTQENPDTGLQSLNIGDNKIQMTTEGEGFGAKKVKASVDIEQSGGAVILSRLDVEDGDPDEVMKKMLQSLYTLAQDSGKVSIVLPADFVGNGVEVVKMGFLPEQAEWDEMRLKAANNIADASWYAELTPNTQAKVDAIITTPDPSAAFALVALGDDVASKIITDDWTASLDIEDTDSVAMFLDYLGG